MKTVAQSQKECWARTIERRGCTATILATGVEIKGVLRPRKEDPVVYDPEGSANTASPNRYVFTSITAPLPETGRVSFTSIPGKTFAVVDVDYVTEGDESIYYRATVKVEDDV